MTGTLSSLKPGTSDTSSDRQARDPWLWDGWGVWAGERHRWFVYATFGHSAAGLDSAVAPAEDERDNNILNVAPHFEYMGSAVYEYLPLPDEVNHLIATTTVEILTLRPTTSVGLGSPARE